MGESRVERRTEWTRPAGDDYAYVDGKRVEFAEPPKSWVEAFARARHARFVSLEEGKRRLAARRAAGEVGPSGWGAPSAEDIASLPTPPNPEWRERHTTSDEPIPTSGAAVLKAHPDDASDTRNDV